MKLGSTKLFSLLLVFSMCVATDIFAQDSWEYKSVLKFPIEDSVTAKPYLCALDVNERLYVATSTVTDAKAHNAIYYADPSDTSMKLMVDLTAINDTINTQQIIGITTIDNDLFFTTKTHKSVNAAGVSRGYYVEDGDWSKAQLVGHSTLLAPAGWGTLVYAVAATKDSIVFCGMPFGGTSVRGYNFGHSPLLSAKWSSYINMDGVTPQEPGGAQLVPGFDIIRDCATNPIADYSLPETKWYSSRNSGSNQTPNGGIAAWTLGTEYAPKTYAGARISDAAKDLEFGISIPYGITVDTRGRLWVAGIDTLRCWVKCYEINEFNFATEAVELPGQFSQSTPDGNGAPFTFPADVAVTRNVGTAYVIDAGTKAVYKFKNAAVIDGVDDKTQVPSDFSLSQNYPNPFNPSTSFSYSLPKEMNVKIVITNSLGQIVATPEDGYRSAGNHTVSFNATRLSSGIYFYTLRAEGMNLTKKMMLVK